MDWHEDEYHEDFISINEIENEFKMNQIFW